MKQKLQKTIQSLSSIIPRGWSPLLILISKVWSPARLYPAQLSNGDIFYLDLQQSMCHGYFFYGEIYHEKYSCALMENTLKPGDVFIDIGANVGYFTQLASKLVKSDGVVHAFEPMPEAHPCLDQNTAQRPNVQVHKIALSNISGSCHFSVKERGDTSSLEKTSKAKRTISVEVDTLDNLLGDTNRIDFIKIDVEGFEYEVLSGALNMIKKHLPILYFEFIPEYASNRNLNLDSYKTILEPLGYRLVWINPEYPVSSITTKIPSCYIIGIPAVDRWNLLTVS